MFTDFLNLAVNKLKTYKTQNILLREKHSGFIELIASSESILFYINEIYPGKGSRLF